MITLIYTSTASSIPSPSPQCSLEDAFRDGQTSFLQEFNRLSDQQRLSLHMILDEISSKK